MKTFALAQLLCLLSPVPRFAWTAADTVRGQSSTRNTHDSLIKTLKPVRHLRVLLALGLATLVPTLFAQITIPGADGSDGALNITVTTNIDLSQAVSGNWDTNNAANAGRGIYDVSKWAVVFKYSSVNIAPGATVTFSNHPSRAPVVWLVNGNVTNRGTISLDGAAGSWGVVNRPETAPGGFRGGQGGGGSTLTGPGFGPGGGSSGNGHYGPGQARSYGNSQVVPLIGGSGGAGNIGLSGSGGGGAILVAASGTIANLGNVLARSGSQPQNGNSYGSGGAIRLVADQVAGDGFVDASGTEPGRVRIEANGVSPTLGILPVTQASSTPPVAVLWPEANAPSVRVVSVSGQAAPLDPRVVLENNPADVNFSSTNSTTVVLETKNFPTNGTVNVFVKPRNAAQSTYQATWMSGDTNTATWQVQHVFLPGYAVIQARAVAQ